jgi:hypothetical protein
MQLGPSLLTMIILKKSETNIIALTLTEKSELINPYWVIEFKPDLIAAPPTVVVAPDDSPFPRRWNRLTLIDTTVTGGPDPYAGEIDLAGGWGTYKVYESMIPTIDIQQTTEKVLEEGKYWVEWTDLPFYNDDINNIYL